MVAYFCRALVAELILILNWRCLRNRVHAARTFAFEIATPLHLVVR
jgi:hypothetical protein